MAKKINNKFFEEWNQEMAYVLGYLFADGCIYCSPRGYWSVHFGSKDLDMLEKIKQAMESEHRIVPSRDYWQFVFSNQNLVDQLLGLGLTPNKSKHGTFPDVPSNYLADFIRGYFDGNGHFTYEKHKGEKRRLVCGFSFGSEQFGIGLIKALHSLGLREAKLEHVKRKEGSTKYGDHYQIRYYQRDTKALASMMYASSTIHMDRKKQYYDSIQNGLD